MKRIIVIVAPCLFAVACAPFRPTVSVHDHETHVMRGIMRLEVHRPDSRGGWIEVHQASFEAPTDVDVGPCQFEDGTVAARCVIWPEGPGRRQVELKPDWKLVWIPAPKAG